MIYDLADEMSVEFTFTHNKQAIVVNRAVKRDKPQKLRVWIDGVEKTERLLNKNQEIISKALGMSYELLLSTSVAQQDEINILSNMGPTDREKILSEMLQIETWEKKKKAISSMVEGTKQILEDIATKERDIASFTTELTEKELRIDEHEKGVNNLRTTLTQVNEKLAVYTERLKAFQDWSNLRSQLAIKTGLIQGIEKQLQSMPQPNEEAIKKVVAVSQEGIVENNKLIREIQEQLLHLKDMHDKTLTEISEANLLQQLEPQTKILETVPCVGLAMNLTCELLKEANKARARIQEGLKTAGAKDIHTWKNDLTVRRGNEDQIKQDLDTHLDRLTKANQKFELTILDQNRQLEAIKGRDEIRKQHDQLINEIQTLQKQMKAQPEYNSKEHAELMEKAKSFSNNGHAIQNEITKLTTEKSYLIKAIQQTGADLFNLKAKEKQQANYTALHRAYNEIPSLLFEEAIPTIEQYTNEILDLIMPGRRVQLRSFRETKAGTQQKSLDVVGMTPTGNCDFSNLSGSEKFRQSLALRIAIARYNKERNNVTIDFFVVDEGFGSLDGENIVKTKQALKELASRFDLFLIITHVDRL